MGQVINACNKPVEAEGEEGADGADTENPGDRQVMPYAIIGCSPM